MAIALTAIKSQRENAEIHNLLIGFIDSICIADYVMTDCSAMESIYFQPDTHK